ncbi:unnamed protein product, partial [marine sediment metagenome]
MAAPQLRGSLYIDGQWSGTDSGQTIDVINPATEEAICRIDYCDRSDTERAVDAAAGAAATWRALTPYEREIPLRKVAQLIRERVDEVAG